MNYYTNTIVSSEQPVISNSAFNCKLSHHHSVYLFCHIVNLARNLKPNKSAVFDKKIINSIQL